MLAKLRRMNSDVQALLRVESPCRAGKVLRLHPEEHSVATLASGNVRVRLRCCIPSPPREVRFHTPGRHCGRRGGVGSDKAVKRGERHVLTRQRTREAQLVAIGVAEVEESLPPFSVARRKLGRQPHADCPVVERVDI